MKRILYTLVVLAAVFFTGCREDQLEGNVPGKEVALTFSGRAAGLSAEALSKEVETLHLLIFNEDGSFSQQKEFAGLADVAPVKLPLGTYTFAYLFNVGREQISGLSEGASLDDVVVALQTDGNGEVVMPGSIFSGVDKITVGEDKVSDAALNRMVGRLDVNVSGVKAGVELQSVTLLGSPKSVNFTGTPGDTKARLVVPMSKNGELMQGQAVAFPTCVDSLARLEFVVVKNGVPETHVSELKNKVEANKIHTINVKVNVTGDIFDVEIEMSVEEWGGSESEDLIANEKFYVDGWTVRLATGGMFEDLDQIQEVSVSFMSEKGQIFGIRGRKGDEWEKLEFFGDTLVLSSFGGQECGNFTVQNIDVVDAEWNRLYVLPAPVKNVVIDTTGIVNVVLPSMLEVAESDKAALLELREVMKAAGVELSRSWKSDNINLWYEVELNAEGRVVGIGYSDLDDYEDDYGRSRSAKVASKTMSRTRARASAVQAVWRLPESFKNLTALKYFNCADQEPDYGVLAEIPAFIKEMSSLEELGVPVNSTTLPELPAGLKYLDIRSTTLKQVPAHIGDLTQLQVLIISVPEDVDDEVYDSEYFPAYSLASVSSIEMGFNKLTELKALYLVGAANCELPSGVWDLPGGSLRELGLCGFSRIQVPVSVSKWSVLEELTLINTTMQSADIENIKNLKLSDLDISSPVFGQSGLPAWLGGMSSLEYLMLYDCGITSIPDSFDGLVNLRDLDMPRNPDLSGKLPPVLLRRYNAGNLYVYAPESENFQPDGTKLKVTPERILAASGGGEYFIEIETENEWRCRLPYVHEEGFLMVTSVEGTILYGDSLSSSEGQLTGKGNAKLKVKVEPNMYGRWSRNGEVEVSVSERNVARVYVEQEEEKEEVFNASMDSLDVANGETFSFTITSNTEWDVYWECVEGGGNVVELDAGNFAGSGRITGRLELLDNEESCRILMHLNSRYSGREKIITINGYRK